MILPNDYVAECQSIPCQTITVDHGNLVMREGRRDLTVDFYHEK